MQNFATPESVLNIRPVAVVLLRTQLMYVDGMEATRSTDDYINRVLLKFGGYKDHFYETLSSQIAEIETLQRELIFGSCNDNRQLGRLFERELF